MSHKLEKKIKYSFKNQKLIKNAFIHKSFLNEKAENSNLESYDILEFLGDAVLELVIREELIKYAPKKNEGELSKIKAFFVGEKNLAEIALSLDLNKYIVLGKGEEQSKGDKKTSILADVLEALFGAIYLDSNFETVKKIIHNLFQVKKNLINLESSFIDYKTSLQEISQEKFKITPTYELVKEEGPAHNKTFKVKLKIKKFVSFGNGSSIKKAEQDSARKMLEKLTMNN